MFWSLQYGSLPDGRPDLPIFVLRSPLGFPSITLCQVKLLKEGAEREAERGEQRFGPSTKGWDLIPRRSNRDCDGGKRGPRGKRHRGRGEQGGRTRGGTAKRKALVVNSEADKEGREGDGAGGKEKYGCADGNRNE